MAVTYEALKQTTQQDNLVDRLLAEEKVVLNKAQQEGFELGIRSSSKLSYPDFRHFERVMPLATALDDEVLDYLWAFLDGKGYPEQARIHDADFASLLEVDPASRIIFAQGWLEGVLSVWQTMKLQVQSVC